MNASSNSHYWLVKFAPYRTSWTDIVRQGIFTLRGVRSLAARKHLSAMRCGDAVLFYHSQEQLEIVGVMQVSHEAYPDPTSNDPKWLTCDFAPVRTLAHPVSLDIIKADSRFATMALIHQPRLAVMPVTEEQFQAIVEKSERNPGKREP